MIRYKIVEKIPRAEEYNYLRKSVGWSTYDLDIIKKALPNSLYCVCAIKNIEIIGMARVIGDNGLVYYIQDMIITPEYQRQGIGKKIMSKVIEYVRTNARQNSVIGLMASQGRERFYESFGFTKRPNEYLGSGMTIFWQTKVSKKG